MLGEERERELQYVGRVKRVRVIICWESIKSYNMW